MELKRKYLKGLQNKETTYEETVANVLTLCLKCRYYFHSN
jgi:hypothetical protein